MYDKFIRKKWFVKYLLFILPIVNWYTEIRVRWSYFKDFGGGVISAIMFGLSIPLGAVFGWLDVLCYIVTIGSFGFLIPYCHPDRLSSFSSGAEEYEVTIRRKK